MPALYLTYTSPISPPLSRQELPLTSLSSLLHLVVLDIDISLYLPCISPVSPLYLHLVVLDCDGLQPKP